MATPPGAYGRRPNSVVPISDVPGQDDRWARSKPSPERPRCPYPGCPVRWRGGPDRLCPEHQPEHTEPGDPRAFYHWNGTRTAKDDLADEVALADLAEAWCMAVCAFDPRTDSGRASCSTGRGSAT